MANKLGYKKYKLLFDLIISVPLIILFLPLFLISCSIVFIYDRGNPLYISRRVGLSHKTFSIYKIRTMILNADKMGGSSTKNSDLRLLPIGKLIRKLKIDELVQLFNVVNFTMSLVGPRPNTPKDVSYYSKEEKELLSVKPGITDFSSIIFADEGNILDAFEDPDLAYNQLIRPWKSRLGLFYISKSDLQTDLYLLYFTFINIFNRKKALIKVSRLIERKGGSKDLINIAMRDKPLAPCAPPGFTDPISKIKE